MPCSGHLKSALCGLGGALSSKMGAPRDPSGRPRAWHEAAHQIAPSISRSTSDRARVQLNVPRPKAPLAGPPPLGVGLLTPQFKDLSRISVRKGSSTIAWSGLWGVGLSTPVWGKRTGETRNQSSLRAGPSCALFGRVGAVPRSWARGRDNTSPLARLIGNPSGSMFQSPPTKTASPCREAARFKTSCWSRHAGLRVVV